jgi:hypothetical protein
MNNILDSGLEPFIDLYQSALLSAAGDDVWNAG